MEFSHTCKFLLSVSDVSNIYCLFRFKNGIHALSWNNFLAFIVENERRVLSVKNNRIKLIAESSVAVDYKSL